MFTEPVPQTCSCKDSIACFFASYIDYCNRRNVTPNLQNDYRTIKYVKDIKFPKILVNDTLVELCTGIIFRNFVIKFCKSHKDFHSDILNTELFTNSFDFEIFHKI